MRQIVLVFSLTCSLLLLGPRGWALEFTADQVTKIQGKLQKANIYYRDTMWRIEHHTMGPVNVSIVRKVYERSRQALAYTLDAQDKGSNEDYTGGWAPNAKTRTNDRVLTAWCLYQLHANQITQESIGKSSLARGPAFVFASQKRNPTKAEADLGGFAHAGPVRLRRLRPGQ